MPVSEHGWAFPVPGPPAYIKLIARTVLPRAAFDGWEYYERLIDNNGATLWCIPGCGFCLFSVRIWGQLGLIRELVLHAAEGVGMVHWKRMHLLFDLARKLDCEGIFVHSPNPRIQKWLKRWGYMELNNKGDFRWVQGRKRTVDMQPIAEPTDIEAVTNGR
jgi:hypothetical protein